MKEYTIRSQTKVQDGDALDPLYAKAIGVDVDELLISQPDTGEQALEIVDTLVRSGALDVLVIDSVAALTPRAEIEGEMGQSHVGLQARLMSQALRKLAGNIHRHGDGRATNRRSPSSDAKRPRSVPEGRTSADGQSGFY